MPKMEGCHVNRVVIATRFWGDKEDDFLRLWHFIFLCNTHLSDICLMVVVAVNEQRDKIRSSHKLISKQEDSRLSIPLEVLPIFPWGGVTHALNLIHHRVRVLLPHCESIIFQSPEVLPEKLAVQELLAIMTAEANTLVVGQAFDEHKLPSRTDNCESARTFVPLSGEVCPWNTMALWNIQKLARTGFPSVADDVSPPGMEEIGAVALQQKLFGPKNAMARIHRRPCSVNWFTNFNDEDRQERHQEKLSSKVSRGNAILQMLGLHKKEFYPIVAIHYTTSLKNGSNVSDFERNVAQKK